MTPRTIEVELVSECIDCPFFQSRLRFTRGRPVVRCALVWCDNHRAKVAGEPITIEEIRKEIAVQLAEEDGA